MTAPKKKKASINSIKYAFKEIIYPRRKILFLGLVLIVINRLAGLVLPAASKQLIDEVITPERLDLLKYVLMAVGTAVLVQALTSFFLTQLLSVEAQKLIAELRIKVHQQVIKLPLDYFDNTKSGEVVSRIMSDVEGVRNLVGTGLVQLIGGLLTAVLSLFLLINISPSLTAYVLIPLGLFALISMRAFKYIRPIFRERSKIKAEVTGRLTESIGGIRVVKGFHGEDFEISIFEEGAYRLFNNVKKSLISTSIITSSSTLLLGLASTGIMGLGAYRIISGEMTIGDFFAFTLYLGFMVAPIVQMSSIGTQITEAFAGLDRMEELFKLDKEGEEEDRNKTLDRPNGHLIFDQVSFSYEEGKEVLHNVSFEMPAGSVTALVGSSGAGKSTIAGLTASFLQATDGNISIDGIDLKEIELDAYRQHLGLVLQEDFLFEGTIRENIIFAKQDATDAELQNAIKSAYVNEFTDRFDEGIETLIGERGIKLSGGQRQRIAIARAILADPKILILDEATSSLDTESEALIQASLNQLMHGRTTLVIAHRLSTVQKADNILVMEDGQIIESGNHQQLIEKQGRYHQLFTYQSRI